MNGDGVLPKYSLLALKKKLLKYVKSQAIERNNYYMKLIAMEKFLVDAEYAGEHDPLIPIFNQLLYRNSKNAATGESQNEEDELQVIRDAYNKMMEKTNLVPTCNQLLYAKTTEEVFDVIKCDLNVKAKESPKAATNGNSANESPINSCEFKKFQEIVENKWIKNFTKVLEIEPPRNTKKVTKFTNIIETKTPKDVGNPINIDKTQKIVQKKVKQSAKTAAYKNVGKKIGTNETPINSDKIEKLEGQLEIGAPKEIEDNVDSKKPKEKLKQRCIKNVMKFEKPIQSEAPRNTVNQKKFEDTGIIETKKPKEVMSQIKNDKLQKTKQKVPIFEILEGEQGKSVEKFSTAPLKKFIKPKKFEELNIVEKSNKSKNEREGQGPNNIENSQKIEEKSSKTLTVYALKPPKQIIERKHIEKKLEIVNPKEIEQFNNAIENPIRNFEPKEMKNENGEPGKEIKPKQEINKVVK